MSAALREIGLFPVEDAVKELARVRLAVEAGPCPWSACCRTTQHPGRDGALAWRPCWKAKALGVSVPSP